MIIFEPYTQDRQTLANIKQVQNEFVKSFESEVVRYIDAGLHESSGGNIEVGSYSLKEGSIIGTIILVLQAGVLIYDYVSKYKDFSESVNLGLNQLRNRSDRLLKNKLPNNPGFTITMNTSSTILVDSINSKIESEKLKTLRDISSNIRRLTYIPIVFWYLVVSNVILLVIITVLIYQLLFYYY